MPIQRGDVVREVLQRDDLNDGQQVFGDFGHLDHVLRDVADLYVAFVDDGNDRTSACLNLACDFESFFVAHYGSIVIAVARGEDDDVKIRIDESLRPVAEL